VSADVLAVEPASAPRHRLAPAILIVAVLAVTVFGGYVVAAALSEPIGRPLDVGGVVRVPALSGWEFAGRSSTGGIPAGRLTRGSGNLDVLAARWSGSAADLAGAYAARVLGPGALRLSTSQELRPVSVAGGLAGVRFSYVGVFDRGGTPIEGEVTAAVSGNGAGVLFDAWSPEGLLQYVRGDVEAMEDRAVLA
jgi:hypothetical protein